MRLVYSALMYLALPLWFGYFALRGLRDRGYWRRWPERLGAHTAPPGGVRTVVHAASVGEVNAVAPLIERLLATEPRRRLLLTTFTPTGARRARERFGERVEHAWLPLDLPGAMGRFLEAWQPDLLLVAETELWPNLYFHAARRGIRLALVNARMSRRSARRYGRFKRLTGDTLAHCRLILAQNRVDAARFMDCGAPRERTRVTGNLKFDVAPAAASVAAGAGLRARWGPHRPVLTAGSTHAADEVALLAAWVEVLAAHPGALLVLVPRHPERFPRVVQAARATGLGVAVHSAGETPGDKDACLVVDAMGVLMDHYAAADVAFVGGTLAAIGGHNVLEPAALGKPLLLGPHDANIRDTAAELIAAGAAERVTGVADLRAALTRLLGDAGARAAMSRAALQCVEAGRGAVERTLDALSSIDGAGETRGH